MPTLQIKVYRKINRGCAILVVKLHAVSASAQERRKIFAHIFLKVK